MNNLVSKISQINIKKFGIMVLMITGLVLGSIGLPLVNFLASGNGTASADSFVPCSDFSGIKNVFPANGMTFSCAGLTFSHVDFAFKGNNAHVDLVSAGVADGKLKLTFDPHMNAGTQAQFYMQVSGAIKGAGLSSQNGSSVLSEVVCTAPVDHTSLDCMNGNANRVAEMSSANTDPAVSFASQNVVYTLTNIAANGSDVNSFTLSFAIPQVHAEVTAVTQANVASNCADASKWISGFITDDGTKTGTSEAVIKNSSTDCIYQGGFSSWKMYENVGAGTSWITSQTLFDKQLVTLKPNTLTNLHVKVPDCRYQLDLFEGTLPVPPDFSKTSDMLLNAKWELSNLCQKPVIAPSADVQVVKTVNNNHPYEGDTVTYDVIAVNHGPDVVHNVVVTDVLPQGLTYVSSTAASSFAGRGTLNYDAATGKLVISEMNKAEEVALVIKAKVDAGTAGKTITNTATDTQKEKDTNTSNDTASVSITVQSRPVVTEDCTNVPEWLEGHILDNGKTTGVATAKIINKSKTCHFDVVGFASWKMYVAQGQQNWISSQTLFQDVHMSIAPGQTLGPDVLKVSVPNCQYQLDLYEGTLPNPPDFATAIKAGKNILFDSAVIVEDLCKAPTVNQGPVNTVIVPAPAPKPTPAVPLLQYPQTLLQMPVPQVLAAETKRLPRTGAPEVELFVLPALTLLPFLRRNK